MKIRMMGSPDLIEAWAAELKKAYGVTGRVYPCRGGKMVSGCMVIHARFPCPSGTVERRLRRFGDKWPSWSAPQPSPIKSPFPASREDYMDTATSRRVSGKASQPLHGRLNAAGEPAGCTAFGGCRPTASRSTFGCMSLFRGVLLH